MKLYSRNSSFGSVYAERFNRSFRDILKKPVFENGESNWIDILPTKTKQNIDRVHTSTKLTPILAGLKNNEVFVYNKLLDKRKKINPRFQVNDLFRTTDLKRTFSKSDTTNWSYILY